jgi:hypothetical protein
MRNLTSPKRFGVLAALGLLASCLPSYAVGAVSWLDEGKVGWNAEAKGFCVLNPPALQPPSVFGGDQIVLNGDAESNDDTPPGWSLNRMQTVDLSSPKLRKFSSVLSRERNGNNVFLIPGTTKPRLIAQQTIHGLVAGPNADYAITDDRYSFSFCGFGLGRDRATVQFEFLDKSGKVLASGKKSPPTLPKQNTGIGTRYGGYPYPPRGTLEAVRITIRSGRTETVLDNIALQYSFITAPGQFP